MTTRKPDYHVKLFSEQPRPEILKEVFPRETTVYYDEPLLFITGERSLDIFRMFSDETGEKSGFLRDFLVTLIVDKKPLLLHTYGIEEPRVAAHFERFVNDMILDMGPGKLFATFVQDGESAANMVGECPKVDRGYIEWIKHLRLVCACRFPKDKEAMARHAHEYPKEQG